MSNKRHSNGIGFGGSKRVLENLPMHFWLHKKVQNGEKQILFLVQIAFTFFKVFNS